jgi:PAS domain S-box-containing protein
MNRIFRRLPLLAKLLLIAIVPILFIVYLTAQLYVEKTRNLAQIKSYLDRIDQSATISRLISQLQKERRYSFDYALKSEYEDEMYESRKMTDSLLAELGKKQLSTLKEFNRYTFIAPLDSIRQKIDRKVFPSSAVMHNYTTAIFRLGTLNFPPVSSNEFLQSLDNELTSQKILSELITYLGIINANVYNILYTKEYIIETLAGTKPSYDVFKLYEQELLVKANKETLENYRKLKAAPALSQVFSYIDRLFTTYQLDTTYTSREWFRLSDEALKSISVYQSILLANAEAEINNYYAREEASQERAIYRFIAVSLLLIFLTVYVVWIINKSLNELRNAALRIAEGKTDVKVLPQSNDAIGSLALSINTIDEKNKTLAQEAEKIGKGDFNISFQPRSDEDVLGNAILKMKESLRTYTNDLKVSREEFVTLADFMPQIVWIADDEGKITYYNKKWYELTNLKETGQEQNWIPILHPEDVGRTLTTWYRSLDTGQPYEMEYRFKVSNDNKYRWFLGRVVPVKDNKGNIIKWFGTATDIHDQKMHNENLEILVEERTLDLNRSNEDLQQFAHVASHDLKEPLRKIRTFSNRLEAEFGKIMPEKGRTYIEKIQASSERMSNMIDGILNYSVMNATEQNEEKIDLGLIMDGIISDLELLILQKEAKITYEKLPGIKGSPTLIYQLFYNLVSNSLKFSKADTPCRIHISSRMMNEEELKVYDDIKKATNYLCIIIEDNGIGFNPEYAEKMFNVFTRLNRRDQYEGTGLGLALCKKIVHRHHGLIFAKGEEGKGASFEIVFPSMN